MAIEAITQAPHAGFAAAAGGIARQAESNGCRLREVVVRGSGMRTRWHQHLLPYFALTLEGNFTQAFRPALLRQQGDDRSASGRPLPGIAARPQPDQREGLPSQGWPCHRPEAITCRPGTLLYHPAGECHADHFLSQEVRILQIELESQHFAAAGGRGPAVPGCADLSSSRGRRAAYDLYRELQRPDPFSALAIEGLVLQLWALAHRARQGSGATPAPAWLTKVNELLATRFMERLTLPGLAAAVGVHPTHLAREFNRFEACTVGQRLRQLRVEYVCRLLERSQSDLASIALAAGFSDQSHLTRVFRDRMGLTPAAYRLAQRR